MKPRIKIRYLNNNRCAMLLTYDGVTIARIVSDSNNLLGACSFLCDALSSYYELLNEYK